MDVNKLTHILESQLNGAEIQISSADNVHYTAIIIYQKFEGLSAIKRHQVVYKALGNLMQEAIHAISIKTLTPSEWQSSLNS